MLTSLRVFKFGFQNIARNIGLSIATTFVISVTLFIVSLLVVMNLLTDVATDLVKEKIDVSVYFRKDAPTEEVERIRAKIITNNLVDKTTFVQKDEALEDFRAKHEKDDVISESLSEFEKNPLPDTLIIKSKSNSSEDYQTIVSELESLDISSQIIEEINFNDNKNLIERLNAITAFIKKSGVIVSIIFVLISVLVIYNTIRLTIQTRRREIHIMRLVGAENWFIQSPFIIEGIIYALCAVALTLSLLYPLMYLSSPMITDYLQLGSPTFVEYFTENILEIVVIQFTIAIFLGTISSYISMRKYLHT